VNIAILLLAFAQANDPAPKPEDYPVSKIFSGTPAAPKLVTEGQRRFQTMIRDAAKSGPNFAGHYAIAEWGCGTGCVQIAVVDLESGNVYEGPFGALPHAAISFNATLISGKIDIFYRRDSSLFIAGGCSSDGRCGTYYYSWTGSQFKLIRKAT